MAMTIMLTIPDQVYERAKQLASQQHQEIDEMLLDELTKTIDAKIESQLVDASPAAESDDTVQQERQAYIAMHPELKQKYPGKHVAIYQGELIDVDEDYGALYERIDKKYPDVFVWLDTVEEDAEEVITLRSPMHIEKPD